MYPVAVVDVPPIPIPFPEIPVIDVRPDGRGISVEVEIGIGIDPDRDGNSVNVPDIGRPLLPEFQPSEFYEARLSGPDINATGVEYYIRASDRAGNLATNPANAPAMLHPIRVAPSEYIISGRIYMPDNAGVAGVTVFAHALIRRQREIHSAQTASLGDGSYTLHLPAAGRWEVAIRPPARFFILEPRPSQVVVEANQPGVYDGVDFIVVEDLNPPVIEHNPAQDVEATFIDNDVIIRARIQDDSGRVRAHLVTLPPRREDDELLEGHDLHFLLPYAISSVENETDWTFRIPGGLVQGDFAYFIEAYDRVGNRATHPENPRENRHQVVLLPSPYRIAGIVTDTDGNPVPAVEITFSSEYPRPFRGNMRHGRTIRSRRVETEADGRFDVPVAVGVWEVRVHPRRGFVLREPIESIRIENEGVNELNIVLSADSDPPVIVHQPGAGYNFSEPMPVEVQVTDNHRVRFVALRLFREFDDEVVIFEEGDVDVSAQETPGGGVPPPSDVPPVRGENEKPVEPKFPPDIDFPAHLESSRPGYFEFIPMRTDDGTNYRADLRNHLHGPFAAEMDAVSYVIQAFDAAGNPALSPENMPGQPVEMMHTVPLTAPQTISGTVTVNGEPLAGVTVHLTDRRTVKLFTHTDADGMYKLPAVVGRNEVFIEFGFRHQVVFPADRAHQVAVEAGQHVEGIDFRLRLGQSEPPIPEGDSGSPEPRRVDREDLNGDAFINIFDLVLIATNFGKAIVALEVSVVPNPDVNLDGIVDIFDLVRVATRFGERLLQGAPAPQMQTVDAKMEAIPLERGGSTAKIALKLDTDVEVVGVQFDLAFHSDRAKLLAVEKGDLLGADDHHSFWRNPDIQGNVATHAANVALLPNPPGTSSGQLATVTLQLEGATFDDSFEVSIDNLILVDPDGHGVFARTRPIRLNAEALLLPDHDLLRQNYPNPFNPETWIPFQISREAPVRIEIYGTSGQIVRTLDLGHRSAGVYVSRGRAAYWDGTNNFGERVSSGVYFYTIRAGDYHAVKRMVLMK